MVAGSSLLPSLALPRGGAFFLSTDDMAFERSTPLARSERTRVERPSEIPRGTIDVVPIPADDDQVTFTLAVGDFVLTYHNAPVVMCIRTGKLSVEVLPDTTVTWERFRG